MGTNKLGASSNSYKEDNSEVIRNQTIASSILYILIKYTREHPLNIWRRTEATIPKGVANTKAKIVTPKRKPFLKKDISVNHTTFYSSRRRQQGRESIDLRQQYQREQQEASISLHHREYRILHSGDHKQTTPSSDTELQKVLQTFDIRDKDRGKQILARQQAE